MQTRRGIWASAGVLVGLAGLAVGHAVAALLRIRQTPVVAVTEWFIDRAPGAAIEAGISLLGTWDKAVLVTVVTVVLLAAFLGAGLAARRATARALWVYAALGVIGMVAVLTGRGAPAPTDTLPIIAGIFTWFMASHALFGALHDQSAPADVHPPDAPDGSSRRAFLTTAAVVAVTVTATGVGGLLGRARRHAERARQMLRLPVTSPSPPEGTSLGVEGVAPWRTPTDEFYVIHTALAPPSIDPREWSLRIHGMVDRELTLTYEQLTQRTVAEGWATINCVSNEVGGELIGNAWWSGVRLADLLEEAGVQEGADAVLQTSQDGWTCGTPLAALTDPDRMALLAFGMNGEPLPVVHGFPVRTIVPGLYGFVSACKWVVDIEVTRFEDFTAYWTDKGWAAQAPVKMSSRIDTPRNDDEVPAGRLRLGGSAWAQHTGIERVEVSVDGGDWQVATLGAVPNADTWVQWLLETEVAAGDHIVRVRAVDATGEIQTDVVTEVVPDGATGLHEVAFTAV